MKIALISLCILGGVTAAAVAPVCARKVQQGWATFQVEMAQGIKDLCSPNRFSPHGSRNSTLIV